MRRLTNKEISEIRELYSTGKYSQVELAKKFNVRQNTILYHVNKKYNQGRAEYRKKYYQQLSKQKKKEIYERQKQYNKEYRRQRYKYDPEFREILKQRAREYNRKKATKN